MSALIPIALVVALSAPVAQPSPSPPQAVPGPPVEVLQPEYREQLAVLPEAERDIPKARELFAVGKQAAEAERWDEAIRYFAEAYRWSGSPGQLYSLGRGHRELYFREGRDPVQLRIALLRFRQYLDESPTGRNRANATKYIEELEPYANVLEGFDDDPPITRLMVHSPIAGASIAIDDGEPQPAPLSVDVAPGGHRVAVEAPGFYPTERTVEVPEGATVPLEVVLDPREAVVTVEGPPGADLYVDGERRGTLPAPTAIELDAGPHQIAVAKRGHRPLVRELDLERGDVQTVSANLSMTPQRKLAIAGLAIGGASLVSAATFLGLSLQAQRDARDIADERTSTGVTIDRFTEEQRAWTRRDAMRTGAIVSGVVSLTAGTVGAVLLLSDKPRLGDRLRKPRRVQPSATVTTEQAAAGIRGRF